MDLSVTPRGLLRILADLQLRLSPRPAGLPVLTRCSFALIPSPIPRWHRILLALLASHPAFGLRLKITDSASTLPFSRLARCSFPLWSMCSLIPPCGTFCIEGLVPCRFRQATLRLLPAGATVAGWAIFLPLDQRALFTAHDFCGLVRLLPNTQFPGLPTAGGRQPSWHASAGVAQLPIELPIIG